MLVGTASRRLVRVLPPYAVPVTLFAVYTSRQDMAPRLRSLMDFLAERLDSNEKGPQRPSRGREQLSKK